MTGHARNGKPPRSLARFIDGHLDGCTGALDASALPPTIACAGGDYRLYPDTSVYLWTPHPEGAPPR